MANRKVMFLLFLLLMNILFADICLATDQAIADYIFINGKVYTVNEKQPWAEAVAVKGDRIIFVGSDKDAKKYIGKNTTVVDIKQKLMLPGFIDAHVHPLFSAAIASGVTIKDNSNISAVLNEVRQYVKAHPEKPGYFGFGWDNNLFPASGPTKELLDEITPDKPIVLLSNDGHAGWMNSEAIKRAGITKDFPDPDPGLSEFIRDSKGEPTGAIKETASMLVINRLNLMTLGDIFDSSKKFFPVISRNGITSVFDAGIPGSSQVEPVYDMFAQEVSKDELSFRYFGSCYVAGNRDIPGLLDKLAGLSKKYDSDRLRVNTLKLVTDGTLETRKAAFFKPYLDTGIAPDIVFDKKLYHETLIDAAKRGFDIHLHAIGDKAVHEALEAAAAVRAAGYKDTHITICHVQVWRDEDRKKFKNTGVFVNFTGSWIFSEPAILKYVDKDIYENQFRYKILADDGVVITQGSDFPASYSTNPLESIEMALTRVPTTTFTGKWDVLPPVSEKIPLDLAIQTYTINGAKQLRMEDKIGSIEPGKYADIIVLEKNIFKIDSKEIHSALPVFVMMNGKIRYSDDQYFKLPLKKTCN